MSVPSRAVALLPLAAVLALATASCAAGSPAGQRSSARVTEEGIHSHGTGSRVAPAYERPGAMRAGVLAPLPGAPLEAAVIAGEAWVAEDAGGTTMTVLVTGIERGDRYVGGMHTQRCDRADGGPSFAFDAAGPSRPPNEVHFAFRGDHHGYGLVTVRNPRRVGPEARSVVVREGAGGRPVLCADLRPAVPPV